MKFTLVKKVIQSVGIKCFPTIQRRAASMMHYPIDDDMHGLTSEQKQVVEIF